MQPVTHLPFMMENIEIVQEFGEPDAIERPDGEVISAPKMNRTLAFRMTSEQYREFREGS